MRILLVDDEPMVLRALYRTILSRWPTWEVITASSGEQAVELLSHTPFHLVMTDMQMPGLDGTAVLKACLHHQPDAIRMVLSGHTPLQRILETEGWYHRFLTKPIEPQRQLAILANLNLDDLDVENLLTRHLVTSLERIPSLPKHVAALRALLDQPDPDLGAMGQVVGQDIGLAMTILKLVNSAYLAAGRPITDLQQAVAFLGVSNLRELLEQRGQRMAPTEALAAGLDLEGVWAHSQEVAQRASTWVLAATGDAALAAEAYSVGLLHDVGVVVLATSPVLHYGEILQMIVREGESMLSQERKVLGTDHCRVGAALLSLWALPETFGAVVRAHHCEHLEAHSSLVSLAIYAAHFCPGRAQPPNLFFDGARLASNSVPFTQTLSLEAHWERLLAQWQQAQPGSTP